MRRLWIPVGTVATVVVLAGSVLQVVSRLAHEIEPYERTVAAGELASIRVVAAGGRIEVVGADVDAVSVDAEVHHGLRRTRYTVEPDGTELVVDAGCPFPSSWCDVDQRIVVPRGFSVEVETGAGDVVVRDVDGAVRVLADSGEVELSRIGGDLDLVARSGHIVATDLGSPTVVGAIHDGALLLEFAEAPDEVRGLSDNGEIEVVLPDDDRLTYDVDARTDNGSQDVAVRTDPSSQRSITVASDDGDVTVRYP